MKKAELYKKVIEYFEVAMPVAETELEYSTPFDLLVAVILSAQCTDKRVNMVTPDLIARYPDAHEMAQAHPDEIYNYIKSVSYPNNKAKHLVGMAQKLCNDFGGEVPDTLEELITLPGVGRKTANVVMSNAFGVPAIAVDTHVFRVSRRIGLADANTPEKVEAQLREVLDREIWSFGHHLLIWHGRRICHAQKPDCENCPLNAGLCGHCVEK